MSPMRLTRAAKTSPMAVAPMIVSEIGSRTCALGCLAAAIDSMAQRLASGEFPSITTSKILRQIAAAAASSSVS